MLINLLRMFISTLLRAYELLFIVRAIISWFPVMQAGALMNFLYSVTEPILAPIRDLLQKIPFLQGLPLDFSILVAFLLIDILRTILIYI